MIRSSIIGLLCCFLVGCTLSSPPATVVLTCGEWTLQHGGDVTCIHVASDILLLQSPDNQQVTLESNSTRIDLNGTIIVQSSAENLTVGVVEGTGIVSNFETSRIVQAANQVIVRLREKSISGFQPINQTLLASAPLTTLPRRIQPPQRSTPSLPAIQNIQITPTTLQAPICIPEEQWTATYTVQTGDILSRIANRYNLTLEELQAGNCITNPNRLSPGQVLRVPAPGPTATPTPSAINFRADSDTLQGDDCTTLRWDVDNVSAVFIDEIATSGHDILQICPEETTTYTLRVVYPDGSETTRTVTITVAAS